jgi:hypothetical protein
MASQLDVYRDWLGITETARPLNYYQLLRLKPFEDNTEQVRAHYRKMNAHVRKYAAGEFADASQKLLNELAKAMLCLTDVQRKREYDATLGRKDLGEGRRRTFEEVLLANHVIQREQLDKARKFADAVGMELRDAILQQKMATPEAVMLSFAEASGLPYVELEDVGVDMELAAKVPPNLARQRYCVPVMSDGAQILMATPIPLIPDVEEELRLRFGMPVRTVLCTSAAINQALAKYYPRDGQMVMMPAAGSPAAAKPSAAAKQAEESLSPQELQRQRIQFTALAGSATVTLAMVAQNFLYGRRFTFGFAAFVAITLGAIVAGVTYLVMLKRKS